MTALSVDNLSVDLGGRRIVTDVTFAVRTGTFVGLVGANSVGKSTLIRAIAGLIPSAGGQVLWEGTSVFAMAPAVRARLMAYLPQSQSFHWSVSVEHVVALGRLPHLGPLSRMASHDSNAIAAAMAKAEVADIAGRFVTDLSGGERSRVLLARALAVGAPILLADEPTASLDPYHQLHTMELLRTLSREGVLVIAVLHDLSLAVRFCDRVIVLHGGKVLADGAPMEALTPDHLRTAYGIEAYRGAVGQDAVLVPWKRVG